MKAYFVSDIHLRDEGKNKGPIFLNFLKTLPEDTTHLVLLGDIFDLWIGKHEFFEEKFKNTIASLNSLKKRGVEIHYFEGNHDIHLTKFWNQTLGFFVHKNEYFFNFGGKIIRAEHGDKMNPLDKGYFFLRWLLRTRPLEFLAYNMPGEIVSWIGNNSSKLSRVYTDRLNQKYKDKVTQLTRDYAQKIYNLKPFDLFICGHTHVEDSFVFIINNKSVKSVNLGSWLDKPKAFMLTDSEEAIISV